jgi:hypothetical protein
MATKRCATLVLSYPFSSPSYFKRCIVPLLIVPLLVQSLRSADSSPRTLQSFSVQVNHGQPVYPLPSNVALGLFNPDPLLDVAYFADGKVQLYQNMGNGMFDLVGERRLTGEVARVEWRKTRVLSEGIPDINSWADLHISFTDGRNEVVSHEQIAASRQPLAYTPSLPMLSSLDFREVWRSPGQVQPVTCLAIDDIDHDGNWEIGYCFVPQFGDSNRLVIYQCVGNDSFVVDWDTLITRAYGPYTTSDVDNDGRKEIVLTRNGQIVILECYGSRQYKYYTTNISYSAPPFKVLQTDVNHNGIRELCLLTSNSAPPPGQPSTTVYIAEFASRDSSTMVFTIQTAQYYYYTFDMTVGQIDGAGREEIMLAGGSFGAYLWFDGATWVARYIQTGLQIGATAPMFVNLDSDPDLELFIGGIGPIGHGSCYVLDYVSGTTWTVLWADSSLRNTPLSVNAGILDGQFVVAGANTVDRGSLDTLYTDLHLYYPSGVKLGIWQRDTASVQNFHFLDIDNDGRTNLVAPLISHLIPDHLAVYEYYGTSDVGEDGNETALSFELFQNYPNPFNPKTQIGFWVGEYGLVTLRVFDVLGREIATLLNERKPPGIYKVEWDGGDYPSGVYFYRVQTETGTSTNKMLLLR